MRSNWIALTASGLIIVIVASVYASCNCRTPDQNSWVGDNVTTPVYEQCDTNDQINGTLPSPGQNPPVTINKDDQTKIGCLIFFNFTPGHYNNCKSADGAHVKCEDKIYTGTQYEGGGCTQDCFLFICGDWYCKDGTFSNTTVTGKWEEDCEE